MGWLVYYSSSGSDTLNEDLRAYPRDVLAGGGVQRGRFVFGSIEAASNLVVSTVRMGMHGVLAVARRENHAEDLCRLILVALGIDRQDAFAIAALALPAVDTSL